MADPRASLTSSRSSDRLRAVALRTFQGLAVVHALLLVAQPFLAGSMLDGVDGGLDTHAGVGGTVLFVSMVLIPPAAFVSWSRRSPWPVAGATAFFLVEALQVEAGQSGTLTVHLPLGIALLASGVAFAWWSLRLRR